MQAPSLPGMPGHEEGAARGRRPDDVRRDLLWHPHLCRKGAGAQNGCPKPSAGPERELDRGSRRGNGAAQLLERQHHAFLPLFVFAGDLGHRRRVPRHRLFFKLLFMILDT
jgi:hypothetical protein